MLLFFIQIQSVCVIIYPVDVYILLDLAYCNIPCSIYRWHSIYLPAHNTRRLFYYTIIIINWKGESHVICNKLPHFSLYNNKTL